MAITTNIGGVLKTLSAVHSNVNGVLKTLNTVYANAGGALKQIHSSKPQTLTGTARCTSAGFQTILTNISIPATCTVTFNATIAETPNYSKGARNLQASGATSHTTSFDVTAPDATSMVATAVLPADVYTFKMNIFNVHGSQSGVSYTYPMVTYTITFS